VSNDFIVQQNVIYVQIIPKMKMYWSQSNLRCSQIFNPCESRKMSIALEN